MWNECVHQSRRAGAANRALPDGADRLTCGPAQLDKMLTRARTGMGWLREGASVPQHQVIRDFVRSRAKALKEWAYAGVVFTDTRAVASHLAMGYAVGELAVPIPLLALTVLSWAWRPSSRRLRSSQRQRQDA